MAEIMEKIESVAKEVGACEEKVKTQLRAMNIVPGGSVLTLDQAAEKNEAQLPREPLM